MAIIKVTLNGVEYAIDEVKLQQAYATLSTSLTAMSGGGDGPDTPVTPDEPDTPDEPVIPPVDENSVTVKVYARYFKEPDWSNKVVDAQPLDIITVEKGTTWEEWINANPDRGYHYSQTATPDNMQITYGYNHMGHIYASEYSEEDSTQYDLVNAPSGPYFDEPIGLRQYWDEEADDSVSAYDAVYVVDVWDNWTGKDMVIESLNIYRPLDDEVVAQFNNIPYACTWTQLATMYPDVIEINHQDVYHKPSGSKIYYAWDGTCYPDASDYILDHEIYAEIWE